LNFETAPTVYTAHTALSRYEIYQCKSIQPPILDEAGFVTYLWAATSKGFYLLRQRFEEMRPGPWEIWLEVVPKNSENFYLGFLDYLENHPGLLTQGSLKDAERN